MLRWLRWPRAFSIGTRLTGLTSLLVLALVLGLILLSVQREQASFHADLESQAELLLETLPLTLRDNLYRLELDELLDIARSISDNENVALFIVYDKRGAVLVDAEQYDPVFAQIPDPLGQLLIALPADKFYYDWQATQLVAGRAMYLGNQSIGAMAIGLSTAPLDAKIAALTRQSIILAGFALTLGAALAYLLSSQIINPISELADVAGQMSGGALDIRVTRQSQDEVGQLGAAFNQMADAIQRRELELRQLAAGLERTVEARTAELREQNEALTRINHELIIARRQAEDANRAKSAVLSMVSHELRTPLTSILGFAKLIKKRLDGMTCSPDETDKVEKMLAQMQGNVDVIVSEGERLLALINNVLDLAKIEAGKMEWHTTALRVGELVQRSAAATSALFEAKALELTLDIPESLPLVLGDRDRLIQVLVNLLSNAVKFTESGGVICRARLDGDVVLVSVRDTGIGIAPHDYGKVFEKFVQLGVLTGERYRGTGLGLPICKEIVEYHGGRIWVESALGEGSTFYFTLPLADVIN